MDLNYKILGFSYVDIEGYYKMDRTYCYPDWPMTATTLSDAAKECSDPNCYTFWHENGKTEFRACAKHPAASLATRLGCTLYITKGNKLFAIFKGLGDIISTDMLIINI